MLLMFPASGTVVFTYTVTDDAVTFVGDSVRSTTKTWTITVNSLSNSAPTWTSTVNDFL